MLLKDGTQTKIGETIQAKLFKDLGIENKPSWAIFKLTNSYKFHDEANNIDHYSRRHMIDAFYTIPEGGGNVAWRYFENHHKRKNGEDLYNPSSLSFEDGFLAVDLDTQYDLFYFLVNHPLNADNPYRSKNDASTPLFCLEDRARDAREKESVSKLIADALMAIHHKLTEEELIQVAQRYQMANATDVSIAEVKAFLISRIENKDPREFLKDIESADLAVRAIIQECVDLTIIKYEKKERRWVYEEDDSLIVVVRGAEDPITRLVDFLKVIDDQKNLEYFEESIKTKRQAAQVEA